MIFWDCTTYIAGWKWWKIAIQISPKLIPEPDRKNFLLTGKYNKIETALFVPWFKWSSFTGQKTEWDHKMRQKHYADSATRLVAKINKGTVKPFCLLWNTLPATHYLRTPKKMCETSSKLILCSIFQRQNDVTQIPAVWTQNSFLKLLNIYFITDSEGQTKPLTLGVQLCQKSFAWLDIYKKTSYIPAWPRYQFVSHLMKKTPTVDCLSTIRHFRSRSSNKIYTKSIKQTNYLIFLCTPALQCRALTVCPLEKSRTDVPNGHLIRSKHIVVSWAKGYTIL